ncbi:MAG: type II toxin-antitoxin system RelE/ParE family toxin [Gallionellaceae bacterium]|nr:type II toxin-antitoxin system RelE/ParE family toxin [Gallionellaceae bacterium]
MYQLIYLDSAGRDLEEILQYIAQKSGRVETAVLFVEKLMAQCENIASLPGKYGIARSELRSDIRSISFQSYVIFFRYVGSRLEVVNVVHGNRDLILLFEEG